MDPCSPASGYKIGKVPADVITVSRNHPDSNYREAVPSEDVRVLERPGEFEVKGVLISSMATDESDREDGYSRNVAYVVDIDDIRVCHLGDIREVPAGDEVAELSCDILIVPVGGGRVLGAQKAAEIVSLIEPKIVIPMLYKTDVSRDDFQPVELFVKEMGSEPKTPEQRLNINRSGIPHDTTLVVLNYRGA